MKLRENKYNNKFKLNVNKYIKFNFVNEDNFLDAIHFLLYELYEQNIKNKFLFSFFSFP
jgi:hypothetical protein